jgi:hypothetical protein
MPTPLKNFSRSEHAPPVRAFFYPEDFYIGTISQPENFVY